MGFQFDLTLAVRYFERILLHIYLSCNIPPNVIQDRLQDLAPRMSILVVNN